MTTAGCLAPSLPLLPWRHQSQRLRLLLKEGSNQGLLLKEGSNRFVHRQRVLKESSNQGLLLTEDGNRIVQQCLSKQLLIRE